MTNKFVHILRIVGCTCLLGAVSLFAQSASFQADAPTLSPSGGVVKLTAYAAYEGQPGALGWSIPLPAGWALVGVEGQNIPEIAPDPTVTGLLEFAYLTVPAQKAEFTVLLRYPAAAKPVTIAPLVIVRTEGRMQQIKPTSVDLR